MNDKMYTSKFVFTVEGETEQWYFLWLRDQINKCEARYCNVAVNVSVQQSPRRFYKGANSKTVPEVFHICDVESNEPIHTNKFQRILSEMKEAKEQKKIKYYLGYSNLTFELWMVLHKRDCSGPLNHRRQYLEHINKAFGENFENLDQYKHEDDFKRCLRKLTLTDVIEAVKRADAITTSNFTDGKTLLQHRGYKYYRDNPALSIHEAVRRLLTESGVLK